MRYQRESPDYLPLSDGRTTAQMPVLKKSEMETDGLLGYNFYDGQSLKFRSGATTLTSHDRSSFQFFASGSLQVGNHPPKPQNSKTGCGSGGDVLLQWGCNRRSRGARVENRMVSDETFALERQMISSQKRAASGVAKQSLNIRPSSTSDAPPAMPVLNRNLGEHSGSLNGPLSSTSNSRIQSGCSEKRSPPSPEKTDNAASCSAVAMAQVLPMTNESALKVEAECAPEKRMNPEKMEWPRIYISLSRKEKEEDFLVMKGTKLPHRPKKRSKNVDRSLQYCFPGMWLSDLTRSRYEVREKKCVRKRRRGLKGMEKSVESGSE